MVATKVYDMVTSRILSQLEQGNVPWRKPWSMAPGMRHHNATTSIPYRGINPLMLMMTAEELGYEDVRWLTYRQAAERGAGTEGGEGHSDSVLEAPRGQQRG